ncbi:MAG: glycosyltransferase [Flavobacteriales bacterium]|nr:glycosyltransferase [Flavobacteriales bacterium]
METEVEERVNSSVVLVPHYNNVEGLITTLESISHKSGIDVLVVDDGSNKSQVPVLSVLNQHTNEGVSLILIHISENSGITNALNLGLDYILQKNKNKFVARLDCGDVCVANRFKLQENFLNTNNKIDIVGSWVKWVDTISGEKVFSNKPPISHEKIKRKMSIRCNMIHPSVMYRLSVVESLGKYPNNYEAAEDYAYFFNIAKHFRTANIPKFLTKAEFNKNGISHIKRKIQNKSKLRIVLKYGDFNFHLVYGVLYNLLLIALPYSLLFRIKKEIYR